MTYFICLLAMLVVSPVLAQAGEKIDQTVTRPGGRVGVDIYQVTEELKRQGKF